MVNHRRILQTVVALVSLATCAWGQAAWNVTSPDGRTEIRLQLVAPGAVADYPARQSRLYYEVRHQGQTVLELSPLGITRADQAFVDGLRFTAAGDEKTIDETYTLVHGKRKVCHAQAREKTLTFANGAGAKVEIVVRAYNDGVAFRYRFPGKSDETYTVTGEATGFHLPAGSRVWAHPYDVPGVYTPAYERYCVGDMAVGTASPSETGWAFPVLFHTEDRSRWALITEAAVDGSYCGSHLTGEVPEGVYRILFPAEGEGNGTGAVEPSWTLPWATPWRVVMVGATPAVMVESTLVTDLNPPSIVTDTSWIKPGKASWSWLSDHDSPQDHDRLVPFIDLAAEMGWEYSLIDANWNIMKNGTIHDLMARAAEKGVGLTLWYNSGGSHNVVTEQPRGTMQLRRVRRYEFERLRHWGIKGVKIDFFQSDKQNIMQLYHDILKDAADYHIMVDFHGCTLPRGWSRTYPHLMTMEAVRGAECYSFDRQFPQEAPSHNTIAPFLRNAVGPMDYTPVMFADNRFPHITTYGHELALPIIFESGWLHFADAVAPYQQLPEAPKTFLQTVPVTWDETRFLAGMPSQFVALARRNGRQWYIGVINGQKSEREVEMDLSLLGKGACRMTLIEDGDGPRTFATQKKNVTLDDTLTLKLQPYGGAVAVLTPAQ